MFHHKHVYIRDPGLVSKVIGLLSQEQLNVLQQTGCISEGEITDSSLAPHSLEPPVDMVSRSTRTSLLIQAASAQLLPASQKQSCFHLQTVTDLLVFFAPIRGVSINTSTQKEHPSNTPHSSCPFHTGTVCNARTRSTVQPDYFCCHR